MTNPNPHFLPLLINHDLPYPPGATLADKKATATVFLSDILRRGFGGIVTNVSTHNDYLRSDEEWAVLAHLAAECERLGLRLWIYDENGYPSGGAGGLTLAENPDFEASAVVLCTATVAPGESGTLELPQGHRHFLYAALYPMREQAFSPNEAPAAKIHPSLGLADTDGERSPLVADADGRYVPLAVADCRHSTHPVTLRNDSDTPALLCAFVRKRLYEGTHSVHNVFECRRYIDVTSRDAVAAFLRNTYKAYVDHLPARFHAGAGAITPAIGQVEAIFTDEPSLMGCYINAGLYPRTVRDVFDSDMPLYPVLTWGRDVENAFSARYAYDILPELVALFLGDTDHAAAVREDYHTLLSELYEQSFFTQISDFCARHEVSFSGHLLLEDTIKHHVIFEGNYFSLLRHMHYPGIDMLQSIPSVVRDAAFTPKLVSSVARAYGRPHVMSEVSAHAQGGQVTTDQMYASLAAQYALGVDVFTSYYGKNFTDSDTYTRYNTALGRIGEIMAGDTVADCLLYYPIETFRRHHRPSDAQYGTYTPAELATEAALTAVMDTLLDHQIDFDFIDGDTLSRFSIASDGTLVSPTGHRYAALILPPMDYTHRLADTLSALAERANVLAVSLPQNGGEPIPGCITPATLPDYLPVRALVTDAPTHGLLRLVRDTASGRVCLLCNTEAHSVTTTLTVAGLIPTTCYDPLENTTTPLTPDADGAVTLTLPALASVILCR